MPILVQVDDETLEFPDDMSDSDIQSVLQKEYPSAPQSVEPPGLSEADSARISEQLKAQDQFQQNLRAYTGGSPMAIGGPDMDFARALYQDVPAKIGEGIHAVMQPIEQAAAPAMQLARAGTALGVIGGSVIPEIRPGESVVPFLNPTEDAAGIIPSVRRAAAGMTTPAGLALLPLAGGGGAIARGVQGGFALGAGASIPGGIQSFIEADTAAEQRGAATDVALSALFAGLMGREATQPVVRRGALEIPRSIQESVPARQTPIERTPNAIQQEAASTVRNVQQAEVAPESATQVPSEVSRPKAAEALTPAVRSVEGFIETAPDHGTAQLQHARKGQEAIQSNRPQDFGFVDAEGRFITREEAVPIFEKAYGKKPSDPNRVTSEDLKAQAKSKPAKVADEDLSVVVQSPQKLGDQTMKGYVQIDSVRGGKNEWSSDPVKLIKEGYDIPTTEQFQTLPQGKYTMTQAKKMLKEREDVQSQEKAHSNPKKFPNEGIGSPADEFGAIYGPSLTKEQVGKFNEQAGHEITIPSPEGTRVKLKVKPNTIWIEASRKIGRSEEEVGVSYLKIRSDGTTVLDGSHHGRPIDKMAADSLVDFLRKYGGEKEAVKTPLGQIAGPQPGITSEQVPALGYLPRQSEALGLGEPSMPPTVESVRAQRAAEARTPQPPPKEPSTTEFTTEGENVQMRKSAERATTSEMIPEPVQETIKTAPESFYRQQSMRRVEEIVTEMPDGDLETVPRDSNLYTAAKLEQASRLFKRGENDAGYEVFVELEKEGTRLGQLINQFKMLKGTRPEDIVRVINAKLKKDGKDILNKDQTKTAIDISKTSKDADAALKDATSAWEKNPTPENAAKAEKALLDANESGLELQRFVSKFQPRSTASIIKSVLQGNLLTPISEVANLVGNTSFLPFRAADRGVATTLDILNNYLRGSKRDITVQPIRGTAEALKGFGRGMKQVPDIFMRGTGDVIKGETRAGLHPIQAWINQFAKNPEMPTTKGKLTLQDRVNLAIEGTFGVPAEAMLRGLGAGDVGFKEAARARATATELSLANVPKSDWSFAQKFPELFLDAKALERIQSDTLQAVFQRPSNTLNVITNWIRGRGELFDLALATVAPYKLTPWNIVGEILSYNPLVAFARSISDYKKGNSRSAKLNAGKYVVGSALTAAGWWLYKNGLMSPSLDQRDESQKARVLAGEVLPPNHINISGLKRALSGGDPAFKPGDETADVFRAGGLAGSMFYMTANIGRDFERSPEVPDSEVWGAILRQSTLEQARFGMNQSFLSGVEGLLSAVREGNADNYIRQWGNTVASIPLPNTLTVMSRASREFKPDFREDTFRKQMENIVRNKLGVAGLDDYLPLKRDLWGEPMRETPEGRNAIMYHFFDVFKNKQVTSDPVPLELFRLWRKTTDTRVIPSLPEKSLTVSGTTYNLTADQQSRYAELVGQSRRQIADAVVVNPNFHKLNDEQKIDLLDRAYRAGLQRGKVQFWRESGGPAGLSTKPQRAGFQQE